MSREFPEGNPPPKDPMLLFPVRTRPFTVDADGDVRLLLPRYGESWFGRLCERLLGSPHVSLRLEARGARLWLLCDGSRTLGEICVLLEQEFGSEVAPAPQRVLLYLRQLLDNRCLTLEEGPADPAR